MQHRRQVQRGVGAVLAGALLLITAPLTSAEQALPAEGEASFYADSLHGELTASGEPYDMAAYTAAHQTLDFGTKVKVTYLETNQSVVVRINDRGPFTADRIIDVSRAAAEELGMIDDGHGLVRLEAVAP